MKISDIFPNEPIKLNESTCHSGGAKGSDTYWEEIGAEYGVETKAYSYKTKSHTSDNKVEISEEDFIEGIEMIKIANKKMRRSGINKYMNLLARNWSQVKYSDQIFAIGYIINPGERVGRYTNKHDSQLVAGGTGYAIQMGIDNNKEIYIFDQSENDWFMWNYSYDKFTKCGVPTINKVNFCGIGTRKITDMGIQSIRNVYNKTNGKQRR